MASFQRVALFIFFDAIERDLVNAIRSAMVATDSEILAPAEREKARARLQRRDQTVADASDTDLLHGLDLGEKYAILMRHRSHMDQARQQYFTQMQSAFDRLIPVRNATMHGRPLTTVDYSQGFALAQEFVRSPAYWPNLTEIYRQYDSNPDALIGISIKLLDEDVYGQVLNNLPSPDYDDTGFFPRPQLEKELRRKIKSRHPVITVLGDGGNGKTALTLQTLYGLLQSNDHDFDAFVWVSAKTNKLTTSEIARIEGAISTSLGIFEDIANNFQAGQGTAMERVKELLAQNKVLLVIDNLETVLDDAMIEFAEDVPGDSKVVFTSRVPLGGDLALKVPEMSVEEGLSFLRRLIDAFDLDALKKQSDVNLKRYVTRLASKPLLLKWFAIAVSKGLNPDQITADPKIALTFCLENVFDRLDVTSKKLLSVMALLPKETSAVVLEHVSVFTALQVEAALVELVRFGLVERVKDQDIEQLYRVKPLARSYLTRALRLIPADAEAIIARYRAIAAAFQQERGAEFHNKYDVKVFTVRSQTEALAARRLRHAISLALKGRFEDAFRVVNDLKITNPTYFEVYRSSAFIGFRQGDFQHAINDYEAAIDIARNQPQLHYFYGGFLLRSYGDYEGARRQFELALEIEPNTTALLREAARANFFLYDFAAARDLIDRAWTIEFKSLREEVICNDLRAQLFTREADYLAEQGDVRGSYKSLIELHGFLAKMKPEVVDVKLAEHLLKALPTIYGAYDYQIEVDRDMLDSLIKTIYSLVDSRQIKAYQLGEAAPGSTLNDRSGSMKPEGRTERYGFLRDVFGVETYVNRGAISDVLWRDMCDGRTVRYDIHTDNHGKTWADKVALIQ